MQVAGLDVPFVRFQVSFKPFLEALATGFGSCVFGPARVNVETLPTGTKPPTKEIEDRKAEWIDMMPAASQIMPRINGVRIHKVILLVALSVEIKPPSKRE